MQSIHIKPLVKTALTAAPLIAVIYATPMYIFKVLPQFGFFILWPIITVPILISWLINILLIALVKHDWILKPYRIFICAFIMFGLSGIALAAFKNFFIFDADSILMMRVVNILSVNAIVYVLIDLNLTKEEKGEMELENANLKFLKLEADYKLLKDQINPHFLFNALSTAKSLIKKEPQLAEEFIVKLSAFLRAGINNTNKTISLEEELKLCDDFVALNKIRFGEALQFKVNRHQNNSVIIVPYFSLLSLVENAIKHNALTLENSLLITITVHNEMIEVTNNRNQKFVLEQSTKTGLHNLNQRYILLSANEIKVIEDENYFTVQTPTLKQ